MEYVVFDLEWNQCPYGRGREVRELPFEIIEIGAVKLNSDREVIGKFHTVVKPQVYHSLHYRTREIVHMDRKTLANGIPFPEAVKEFLAFAGPEANFCTWGTTDLPELQRNMQYYGLLHLLRGPMHFYDVQKLFAVNFETMKSRRALEYGIDYLKLEKTMDFHRALSDAWYTAKIFQQIDWSVVWTYDSIDVYQTPKTKAEEIYAIYNGYSKFISRQFKTREEAMQDPEVLSTHCCLCERKAHKKIRWFAATGKNYYAVLQCPNHGYLKGKIRIRRTQDENFYVVKTIKVSGEDEAKDIAARKEELRTKRREKRHQVAERLREERQKKTKRKKCRKRK